MKLGYLEFRRNPFQRKAISAVALAVALAGGLGSTIAAADNPPDPTCTPGVNCPADWPWRD